MTDTKRIEELEWITADIQAQGWMVPEEFVAMHDVRVAFVDIYQTDFVKLGNINIGQNGWYLKNKDRDWMVNEILAIRYPVGLPCYGDFIALRELHTLKQGAE